MSYVPQYTPESITREDVDQSQGPMVIEFGTNWCGFCRGAQADIKSAMDTHRELKHLKIEDGKGRRLGRTFGVKLWPTLIFLQDGQEVTRLVRPGNQTDIDHALKQIQ